MLIFPEQLFPLGHGPVGVDTIARISSSLVVDDSLDSQLILKLVDSLSLATEAVVTGTFHTQLVDSLLLADLIKAAQLLQMTDSIILADDLVEVLTYIVRLSDLLKVSVSSAEQATFHELLASAMVFSDSALASFFEHFTDSADFTDALTQILEATLKMLDTVVFSDAFSNSFVFTEVLTDSLVLDDSLSWSAVFHLLMTETVYLSGRITIDGIDYTAWVLNPALEEFTRYTSYPFNSLFMLEDIPVGLNEEGIFTLGGTTDAGANIDASFKTGLMDFGATRQKNVRYANFGLATNGNLYLKVTVIEDGKKRTDVYVIRPRDGSDAFEASKKLSNSIHQRFWQFEVETIDGATLDVDEIEWVVALLQKTISKGGEDG